jgi:hypothetical protein
MGLPGLLGVLWLLYLPEMGIVLLAQVGEGLAFRAFAGGHFATDLDPTPKIGNVPELAFRPGPITISAGDAPFQGRLFSGL